MQRDVRTAEDLIDALKAERIRQGLSCEQLDEIAGLAERHWCKIENWRKSWGRGLGLMTLPLVAQALGLKITVAPDPDHPPHPHPSRHAIGGTRVTHFRAKAELSAQLKRT